MKRTEANSSDELLPMDILLVEDDPSLRRGLELALGHEGFVIFSASSLKEADSLLKTFQVDALIVDIHLPDGVGGDLLSRCPNARKVSKKLLVTAGASIGEIRNHLNAGFTACLTKPLDVQTLCGILRGRGKPHVQ